MNTEDVHKFENNLARKLDEYRALLVRCHTTSRLWDLLCDIDSGRVSTRVFHSEFISALEQIGMPNDGALKVFADGALHASCDADKALFNHPCHHPATMGQK